MGKIEAKGGEYVSKAIKDEDPNIRIVGLRLARQLKLDVIPIVDKLCKDESPQVRRECAIALRHHKDNDAAVFWSILASQHHAGDRWYLEALGIGADKQWDRYLNVWVGEIFENFNTPAGREIIWRSRATQTPELLTKLILDSKTPTEELPRYFRALDFLPAPVMKDTALQIAFANLEGDAERKTLITREAFDRLKGVDITSDPKAKAKLNELLSLADEKSLVELVGKFNVKEKYPDLLALAMTKPDEQTGVEAIRTLLAKNQMDLVTKAVNGEDAQKAEGAVTALGNAGDKKAEDFLWTLIDDKQKPVGLRRAAVTAAAKSQQTPRNSPSSQPMGIWTRTSKTPPPPPCTPPNGPRSKPKR